MSMQVSWHKTGDDEFRSLIDKFPLGAYWGCESENAIGVTVGFRMAYKNVKLHWYAANPLLMLDLLDDETQKDIAKGRLVVV